MSENVKLAGIYYDRVHVNMLRQQYCFLEMCSEFHKRTCLLHFDLKSIIYIYIPAYIHQDLPNIHSTKKYLVFYLENLI